MHEIPNLPFPSLHPVEPSAPTRHASDTQDEQPAPPRSESPEPQPD